MGTPHLVTLSKKAVTVGMCLAVAFFILSSYAETLVKRMFGTASNLAVSPSSEHENRACVTVPNASLEDVYFVGCGGFF